MKMKLKFTIEANRIASCGYYQKGKSEADFYNISDLIEDLETSFEKIPLIKTKTFDSADYKNQNNVYLYEIIKEPRYALLTTWNEVDSDQNQIMGIKASGLVGSEIESKKSDFGSDFIPGYPSYFLIDKDKSLLYTIRPKYILNNGKKGLETYMQNYICYFTRHADQIEVTSKSRKIVGFKKDKDSKPISLFPKFSLDLMHVNADVDDVIKNTEYIYKIIKKDKIFLSNNFSGPSFIQYLNALRGKNIKSDSQNNLLLELSIRPTEDDVRNLIKRFQENGEIFGFQLEKTNKTLWLDHAKYSEELELNIDIKSGGIIDGRSLLSNVISTSLFRNK